MDDNDHNEESKKKDTSNMADELKSFYTGDFRDIFFSFFKDPINGVTSVMGNPSNKTFVQAIIMYTSVFVLYFIGSFILALSSIGRVRLGSILDISLTPVLLMLIISLISFGIKSTLIKANFKNELICGALCGIPLALLIPVSLLFRLLASSSGPGVGLHLFWASSITGLLAMLILIYLLLMMISVFQQSLRSSGAKASVAWYLAPAVIIFSIYLTFKIL